MTHWVPIYGSGPHRYLRPGPWDPTKVADPTHGAGTLRPTTRPAGSVCSIPVRYPHLERAIFRAGSLAPVYLVASMVRIHPQYTSIVIN